MDASCTGWLERFFSYFLLLLCMVEITSCRCENTKKVTCHLPGFYYRQKTFRSSIQNDSTENFDTMLFKYLTEKLCVKLPRFVAAVFSFGGIPRRPSDSSSSHPQQLKRSFSRTKITEESARAWFWIFAKAKSFLKHHSNNVKYEETTLRMPYARDIRSQRAVPRF